MAKPSEVVNIVAPPVATVGHDARVDQLQDGVVQELKEKRHSLPEFAISQHMQFARRSFPISLAIVRVEFEEDGGKLGLFEGLGEAASARPMPSRVGAKSNAAHAHFAGIADVRTGSSIN